MPPTLAHLPHNVTDFATISSSLGHIHNVPCCRHKKNVDAKGHIWQKWEPKIPLSVVSTCQLVSVKKAQIMR